MAGAKLRESQKPTNLQKNKFKNWEILSISKSKKLHRLSPDKINTIYSFSECKSLFLRSPLIKVVLLWCLWRIFGISCTVCVKRNAHLFPIFFHGPPGGGGPKIHIVDYVNGSSTNAQFFSLKNLQPFSRYFKERGSMSQN